MEQDKAVQSNGIAPAQAQAVKAELAATAPAVQTTIPEIKADTPPAGTAAISKAQGRAKPFMYTTKVSSF